MLNKNFLPITAISIVFLFLISRGCGGGGGYVPMSVNDIGVGVSSYSESDATLDLSADLDPAQLPAIVKSAYLEGAQQKKEGRDLVAFVIQNISEKVSEISTIDLNEDQVPDPILIIPEGNEEQMTFSIRVPDPLKVKSYPDSPDAWQKMAQDQAIEVASVTVFPRKEGGQLSRFDVEARPNEQVYENRGGQHYHGSFSGGFFTGYLMSSLFFNPWGGWFGPGFYGNMGYYNSGYYNNRYAGRDTSSVRRTRTTYNRSTASTKPMTTTSGQAVSSRLSDQKSAAVKNYKSSAISKRDSSRVKSASGFGAKKSAPAAKSGWGSSKSSSWGRSSGRSSWGGGGSRFGK